ncbi:hypothetical protein ACFSO9_01350 [Mesonia maritima]|uniref:hypothetical protein n=1 Tax=Mesonia maritima TaxID=1793873 RepID=UPI00362B67F4
MKKMLLTAVIAALGIFGANAQEGFKLGAHVGLPMGDAEDITTLNLGVDASYHWNVGEGFDVGLATGYTTFLGDDIDTPLGTVEAENLSYIPVAASARYSLPKVFLEG